MDPTDLPSRECTVRQLLKSGWWEGPPWLRLPSDDWPSGEPQPDEEVVMQERGKDIVLHFCVREIRLTGIKPFQTIMTTLFVSLLGFYDLLISVARLGLTIVWGRHFIARSYSLRSA